MWTARSVPVREEFAAGRLPGTPGELRAIARDGAAPPPKKFDNPLGVTDVFEVMPSPGGGYGDPLTRDPRLVAADVAGDRLTVDQAEAIYGVKLDGAGEADAGATREQRERIRQTRLRDARAPETAALAVTESGTVVAGVLETVELRESSSGAQWLACASCSAPLGERTESYRASAAVLEQPLPELDERIFQDPKSQVDEDLVVRQYLCPSCATVLDAVVCPSTDPVEWDVLLEESR
jgi:N-methylhydantoinase B